MQLTETKMDGLMVIEPHGRIDAIGCKRFGERLAELIRSGSHHLLIDLHQILYISSGGFRSLLAARKLVDERDGKLVLCGMSSELAQLFEIGAFTELFTICASRAEGLSMAR